MRAWNQKPSILKPCLRHQSLLESARILNHHDTQITAPVIDFGCSARSKHLPSSIRPALVVRINDNHHDDYDHKPDDTYGEICRKEAGDRAETAITRGNGPVQRVHVYPFLRL